MQQRMWKLSWNGAEKTAENTVQHRGGGGGSMVANHRGGGESSMVVTTVINLMQQTCILIAHPISMHTTGWSESPKLFQEKSLETVGKVSKLCQDSL